MGRTDRELRAAIADIVGVSAVPVDTIVDALVEAGRVPADRQLDDRLQQLFQLDTSFAEVADGVVFVPRLLEGTRWTVPIDADDAARGFVRTHPHLSPLGWWLIGDDVALVDGDGQTTAVLGTDGLWLDGVDTDVVIGPPGWLDELAGGWATVEVVGGGLRWMPCHDVPEPTDAQVAAMRLGFERAATDEVVPSYDEDAGQVELRMASDDSPVHEAVLADRAAFIETPIAPLPELYQAAGLEERRGILVAEGFDWPAFDSWRMRNRLGVLHGLDTERVERLVLAIGACESVLADGDEALGPDDDQRDRAALLLAALLEEGPVTEAFWREAEARGLRPGDVDRFVGVLSTRLDGARLPGLAWLRARALEADGDAAAAVSMLEEAITPECDHATALIELAGYRSDQGDAPAALRLLRRAGVTHEGHHDDESDAADEGHLLLHEVEGPATHRPAAMARRNDPCPCGSGRKYKACHLGRERHSLDDRSAWLYDKAKRYASRHGQVLTDDLTDAMVDPIDDRAIWLELRDSPFVTDVALHEGELLQQFLASREALLPDDEALLAAQWALIDRGVFEIEHVQQGRLELFDIGRSERITVVNTHPSDRTRPGVVLIGRPLPVGDTYRAFSGFLAVPRASVAALLDAIDEGDPFAVVDELAPLFQPPTMQNTDGQDIVFHTLRWQVPDPSRVGPALAAAGLKPDDDEATWRLVRDSANRSDAIIATLRLEDDELVGEANSDERAAELVTLVGAALPDAELLDDEARSLDEAMADHDPASTPAPLDPNDPAVRQVLEAFIVDQEQRWLDESVPALGGRTPREAADDPIGREELRQLLASFPPATEPGMMDPDRLRAALGLDG